MKNNTSPFYSLTVSHQGTIKSDYFSFTHGVLAIQDLHNYYNTDGHGIALWLGGMSLSMCSNYSHCAGE